MTLDAEKFKRHYFTSPYQPFPVLMDVPPTAMAISAFMIPLTSHGWCAESGRSDPRS